ncbi:MAG: hypothetical protein ACREVX_05350 [Clostridium sp.]|uniref:hypothetical protein n=1 Tax=Clostridium sp. TaxID=1506 RepID=UPI003D6D7D7C
MKNASIKIKILTALLTAGIYLSSVSTTFTATANPLYINAKAPLVNEYKEIGTRIQQSLQPNSDIIITNTLTKDQANRIKAVLNKSEVVKEVNTEITKTLTKQEDKIYNTSKSQYINPIISLLDNGTITEPQAEKILMKQLHLYHDRMVI